MKRRLLSLLDPLLQSGAATTLVGALVRLWTSALARLEPAEGLRRMLLLAELLDRRVDALAIELDGGVHPKHRLTRYHDFFVDRVRRGEQVLDVGCGKGELAHDLVERAGVHVTGLDLSADHLRFAREHFHAEGLEFVAGDALEWEPPHTYDVVILSNVLEHIGPRVQLLRRLRETTHARRFLVRVPSIERDWLVPLRTELGLDARSDPTHETEYTPEQLAQELRAAGLELDELVQRWGELWASARAPSSASDA